VFLLIFESLTLTLTFCSRLAKPTKGSHFLLALVAKVRTLVVILQMRGLCHLVRVLTLSSCSLCVMKVQTKPFKLRDWVLEW